MEKAQNLSKIRGCGLFYVLHRTIYRTVAAVVGNPVNIRVLMIWKWFARTRFRSVSNLMYCKSVSKVVDI